MNSIKVTCFFILLLQWSCVSMQTYTCTNEFGTEEISINNKKKTFTFERKTTQRSYTNQGTFELEEEEITLYFKDSIMDARFLPNFVIPENRFQPVPYKEQKSIVVLLDQKNDNPILMQKVNIYDSNWQKIGSEISNLNGEITIKESYQNKMVFIYAAHYNPIKFFMVGDPNLKHIVQMKVLGEFEIEKPAIDIVLLQAMKYTFEAPTYKKHPDRFSNNDLRKFYLKK